MNAGPNFLSVQTDGYSGDWTPFPTFKCVLLHVLNNSAVDIHLRRKGESDGSRRLLLRPGQAWSVHSVTNADQIEVRRADEANDPATVHAEAE